LARRHAATVGGAGAASVQPAASSTTTTASWSSVLLGPGGRQVPDGDAMITDREIGKKSRVVPKTPGYQRRIKRDRSQGIDHEVVVPAARRFIEVGGHHAYPGDEERVASRRSTVTVISPTGDFGFPVPLLQFGQPDSIHSNVSVLVEKRMGIANLRNGGVDR
jgi:hypothetical protein